MIHPSRICGVKGELQRGGASFSVQGLFRDDMKRLGRVLRKLRARAMLAWQVFRLPRCLVKQRQTPCLHNAILLFPADLLGFSHVYCFWASWLLFVMLWSWRRSQLFLFARNTELQTGGALACVTPNGALTLLTPVAAVLSCRWLVRLSIKTC
jgi:hypothetical protein